MNDLIKIGRLTRLHGIKGSVILHIQDGQELEVKKIKNFFIDINQTPTPFFVTEIKLSNKNLIVSFDSISTIEAAQKIIGCEVWVDKKNIKKQALVKDLTGYILSDKNKGNLGLINEVIDMPGHKLFSVDIKGHEVLLPFSESLIEKIDHKTKTVIYVTPEGLIDIYTS